MDALVKALMQEKADKVARHLFAQGHRALAGKYDTAGCAYRGTGGDSCAIGCLIPDDVYTDDIEGISIDEVIAVKRGIVTALGITPDNRQIMTEFYEALQAAHDTRRNWDSSREMVSYLVDHVYDYYELNRDVLNTLHFSDR